MIVQWRDYSRCSKWNIPCIELDRTHPLEACPAAFDVGKIDAWLRLERLSSIAHALNAFLQEMFHAWRVRIKTTS